MEDNGREPTESYKLATHLLFHELDSLFARFNYFLAGTAFLATAFAVVVVSSENNIVGNCQLKVLAHAINAVGFYIAFFFMTTNYLNAKLIGQLQQEIMDEGEIVKVLPYTRLKAIIDEAWHMRDFLRDFKRMICNPLVHSKRSPSSYTIYIPSLFIVFWVVIWFVVLQIWYIPFAFCFGAPGLYFLALKIQTK